MGREYQPILNVQLVFSGAAIDLSCLRILDGKVCWVLYIDGLVISADGNLLDVLSIAIKVPFLFPSFIAIYRYGYDFNFSLAQFKNFSSGFMPASEAPFDS